MHQWLSFEALAAKPSPDDPENSVALQLAKQLEGPICQGSARADGQQEGQSVPLHLLRQWSHAVELVHEVLGLVQQVLLDFPDDLHHVGVEDRRFGLVTRPSPTSPPSTACRAMLVVPRQSEAIRA